MDSGPIVICILFSLVAMAIAAIVAARCEDLVVNLNLRIIGMKNEIERLDREMRDVSKRVADGRRELDKAANGYKAEIEQLKIEFAEITSRSHVGQSENI